jgi:hypothetical protein
VLKYHCDDLGYFYSIRDEIFPININSVVQSALNSKIIKGKSVKLNTKHYLSSSQALEWFKNIPFTPISEEKELFIPY